MNYNWLIYCKRERGVEGIEMNGEREGVVVCGVGCTALQGGRGTGKWMASERRR